MSNSLYKISEDYSSLMTDIEEAEGVLTPEMEKELTINKSQLQTKSIAYQETIRKHEAFTLMAKDEIKRLEGIVKRNNTLVDHLKSNLLSAVNLFGEFTVGTVTFGKRKSESVTVEDVNSLPKEYKTIKVVETANKADLKAAIKDGKEIDGVHVQTNYSLKIK